MLSADLIFFAAGADTILASTLNFVLAMLHAPEVQKKAQEELSRVIGNGRLPVPADRAVLPYIDAIVKETYRWEQGQRDWQALWLMLQLYSNIYDLVIPLGVPHRVMKDDVYNGYFIPEGMWENSCLRKVY